MTRAPDFNRDAEQQALDAFLAASAACMVRADVENAGGTNRQQLCERAMELQSRYLAELDAALQRPIAVQRPSGTPLPLVTRPLTSSAARGQLDFVSVAK